MKALNRMARLCIGCYILILGIILVIIPNLPLIGILLACKYIESCVYFYVYEAEVIVNYDFFKLSSGPDKNVRTTLLIANGKVEVKDVRELVVLSLIDAHAEDSVLCFPQLTKRHLGGIMNNYWVEEDNFTLSDHVFRWGEEVVYTNVELQQILVRLKYEKPNIALSPWAITLIPLQFERTAIVVRCHPALKDLDLIQTLLEQHKLCNHERTDRRYLNHGSLHLIKCLSLSCWNLAEFVLNHMKAKPPTSKESSVRKVLMWSKPIDVRMFGEMAKHLNVGITELLLGCVSYIVNDLETFDYTCALSIAGTSNPISSNAFPIKSGCDDPVSTIIKSKENLRELSSSGKLFTSTLFEHMASLILPIRFAKYVVQQKVGGVKVNITSLLADNEDASLLSYPLEMISVWCEENAEFSIEICLANTKCQLMIATDAYHTQQSTSQHLFQQFEEVVKKLAAETGVFTRYYN